MSTIHLPTDHLPADEVQSSPVVRPISARIPIGRLSRWYDRIEAFVSRLSVRDNFWHRVCSLIWLPYAFFSGIRIKRINAETYAAILPFRRFNRNWYRAMAGGALWPTAKSPAACTSSESAAEITRLSASTWNTPFCDPASDRRFIG